MKLTGIYQIRNLKNGKIYVGSSNNILQRWREHKSYLNRQRHRNCKLQSAWNKYDKNSFVFEIIEFCSEAQQFDREQYWLNLKLWADYQDDRFDKLGYNISRKAELNSVASGEKHHNAKLTSDQVLNIILSFLNNETYEELAKRYNVSISTISGICNRRSWPHLHVDDSIQEKLRIKISIARSKSKCRDTKERMKISAKKRWQHLSPKEKIKSLEWRANIGEALKKTLKNKGENASRTKLTSQQVIEIRTKYGTGLYTERQLSIEYGVYHTTIHAILVRKSWASI